MTDPKEHVTDTIQSSHLPLYRAASRTCPTCGGWGRRHGSPDFTIASQGATLPCPYCSGGRVSVPIEEAYDSRRPYGRSVVDGDATRPTSWAEMRPGDRVIDKHVGPATIEFVSALGIINIVTDDDQEFDAEPADLELDCDHASELRQQHPAWRPTAPGPEGEEG